MNFEDNYYKLKYLKYKNKYVKLQTDSGEKLLKNIDIYKKDYK